MKNKPLIVVLLSALSLVAGLVIENKTGLWGKWTNSATDSTTKRKDSSAVHWDPSFSLVTIKSPTDGELQKAYYYKSTAPGPQPLLISLHSWSWDYTQSDTLSLLSKERNINYIHPDFRGQNWTKDACCSDLALGDIDAAIDYAIAQGNVDTSAIYVTGRSGGGYATLATFMKSRHHIKKFSAWVPLTDLVAWYDETRIRKLYYADNILVCTHSVDKKLNKEIAIQKSPFYWTTPVQKLTDTKLNIYLGVYDGLENNGPIPITQSIRFYNKLLTDLKVTDSSKYISNAEILQLLETRKPLRDYGRIADRDICLTKEYGNIRITIFTGGHEMLEGYAFNELMQ